MTPSFAPLSRLAPVLFACSLFLALPGARGELIFADSFAYSRGDLAGQGPPPGSPPGQGGWLSFNGTPAVSPVGLAFGGIFSTGNSARLFGLDDANGDKAVASLGPVTAADGAVWVGFLIRKASAPLDSGGFAVVSLGNSVTGPSVGIGKLFARDAYGIDNNTDGRRTRHGTPFSPNQRTVWLVAKIDFSNAEEYLWVDPSPIGEPNIADAVHLPMTAAFLATGFSEIVLTVGYTQASFAFDELRVGTRFDDLVSP